MLAIIVAIGKNNEIGKDNKMPWHLKEDLQYFKKITMDKTIIMGRKTFESLPYVLHNRKHVVITRNMNFSFDHENVEIAHDIDEILIGYKNSDKLHFVIGGGDIYTKALPLCDYLYITQVDSEFEANIYFPDICYEGFELISRSDVVLDESSKVKFWFEVYKRLSEVSL